MVSVLLVSTSILRIVDTGVSLVQTAVVYVVVITVRTVTVVHSFAVALPIYADAVVIREATSYAACPVLLDVVARQLSIADRAMSAFISGH